MSCTFLGKAEVRELQNWSACHNNLEEGLRARKQKKILYVHLIQTYSVLKIRKSNPSLKWTDSWKFHILQLLFKEALRIRPLLHTVLIAEYHYMLVYLAILSVNKKWTLWTLIALSCSSFVSYKGSCNWVWYQVVHKHSLWKH